MVTMVEAPPVTPYPYGLPSVALVVSEDGSPRWLNPDEGIAWEPDYCGPANLNPAACYSPGNILVSADNLILTLFGENMPDGVYTVSYGDGEEETVTGTELGSGVDHTYDADGTYTVTVTGPRGVTWTGSYDVADGEVVPEQNLPITRVTQDGIPLLTGDSAVAYHRFRCRLVGIDGEAALADRARRALLLGEGRAMEAHTESLMADHPDLVVLESGNALHPVDAIAAIEEYAGANYGGVPTIHTGRRVATVLTTLGTVVRGSGRLETVTGSLVAAGGGYGTYVPGAITLALGNRVVYATGAVKVHRASTPDVYPASDRLQNEWSAMVQRPFSVAWECFTVAVQVNPNYSVPA